MPELEHDPKLVERLALAHEGNALMHLESAEGQRKQSIADEAMSPHWSQHYMLAASDLAIAASYWSLISPGRAVFSYRRAADVYRSLGHSYWMVLALASGSEVEIGRLPYWVDEDREPSPQAIAFAMVGNEISSSDLREQRSERLNVHWRHVGNLPVGRLGIPLDNYVRCTQTMHAARALHADREVNEFFVEAANYIHRATEVIRSASHDRYHWLQLRSAILPAEPEVVAMTTAMSIMLGSTFEIPASEIPNLDAYGRMLVQIGDQMRDAGRLNDDRQKQ